MTSISASFAHRSLWRFGAGGVLSGREVSWTECNFVKDSFGRPGEWPRNATSTGDIRLGTR